MLYLTNQRCPDIEMIFMSEEDAVSKLNNEVELGEFVSALDKETALQLTDILQYRVHSIEEEREFFDMLPDDVAITLPDNLELGDEIIAVVIKNGVFMFYQYVQYAVVEGLLVDADYKLTDNSVHIFGRVEEEGEDL